MKRRILLSSILTLMLCLSLITGATYALFTSESKVNVSINSGKVELKATLQNLQTYSVQPNQDNTDYEEVTLNGSFLNGGNAELAADGSTITVNKMTPGDKITYEIKLTNNSNVNILYQTIIQSVNDKGLFNGLKVTIDEEQFNGGAVSPWTKLAGEQQVANTIKVTIELPIEANDTYQNTSTEILTTVNAVQGNSIVLNVWDGTSDAEGLAANTDETNKVVEIKTAEQLFAFAEEVNKNNNTYAGYTVKLMENIDLGYRTWNPIGQTGSTEFFGIFDGNNKTIKNLSVNSVGIEKENYASGLFGWNEKGATIQNLTIDGATVQGHHNVAVVAGYLSSTTAIKNVTVKNATIINTHLNNEACGDKTGLIVGYLNASNIVDNCHAFNSTVYSGRDAGQLVGASYAQITNSSATNVKVYANGDCTGANVREQLIGRELF